MTLSLDTNVCIEIIKGRNIAVRRAFAEARQSGTALVTSLIVAHELHFGAERHPRPDEERRRVRAMLTWTPLESYDEQDMRVTARLRAELQGQGLSIGAYDLLIAGQALARGWTVVTGNVREFRRVLGLDVIDWTAPEAA